MQDGLKDETVWYVERHDVQIDAWVRVGETFTDSELAHDYYRQRAAQVPGGGVRLICESTIRSIALVRKRRADPYRSGRVL